MKRFYCPVCKRVRHTRRTLKLLGTVEFKGTTATNYEFPVSHCFRHLLPTTVRKEVPRV